MPEYGIEPEVVRLTLVLGVIVSVLVYEKFQLTTGGAVVPAYLALSANRPLSVLATLAIGLATYQIVTVGLSKKWILYGRRKFEVEVLVGLALLLVLAAVSHVVGLRFELFDGLIGVGFLVPGIIAHDMSRQRPGRTLLVLAATTAVLVAIAHVLQLWFSIAPGGSTTPEFDLASVLGFPRELLVAAVIVSVLAGMVVYERLGLRSGGFITGAYVAIVSPRWGDIVFALVVAAITWAVVVRLLMPRLLIFGRRKLSTMILVAVVVGWALEIVVIAASHGDFVPWRGLTVATLIVPALVANDAQRQGWERTLWGVSLTTLATIGVTNLIAFVAVRLGAL